MSISCHDAPLGRAACQRQGFTLLEVLVALAVIAVTMSALYTAIHSAARNAAALDERTQAYWIASNTLQELKLGHQWPGTGSSEGTAELAGRDWKWTMQVISTPEAGMRRIEIRVARNDQPDEMVSMLTGFIRRPTTAGGPAS